MLGKLAAAVAAGTVALAGLAGGAWGSRIPSPGEDTCEEVLQGAPTGGGHKETDPPDGSSVAPGDEIKVTITWDPATLESPSVDKAFDCVAVDGRPVPELSAEERGRPNDGRFSTRFTVPADLPDGSQVCDRGFVGTVGAGGGFSRHKSNDVCLTVQRPAPPEESPEARSGPSENSLSPGPEAPPEHRTFRRPNLFPYYADTPQPVVPVVFLVPAPAPALAEAPAPPAQSAPATLPVTGAEPRSLLAGAGADLAMAGLAVIGGARRRRARRH
jgi:LPXTG-motif cell wall-anchored protein